MARVLSIVQLPCEKTDHTAVFEHFRHERAARWTDSEKLHSDARIESQFGKMQPTIAFVVIIGIIAFLELSNRSKHPAGRLQAISVPTRCVGIDRQLHTMETTRTTFQVLHNRWHVQLHSSCTIPLHYCTTVCCTTTVSWQTSYKTFSTKKDGWNMRDKKFEHQRAKATARWVTDQAQRRCNGEQAALLGDQQSIWAKELLSLSTTA